MKQRGAGDIASSNENRWRIKFSTGDREMDVTASASHRASRRPGRGRAAAGDGWSEIVRRGNLEGRLTSKRGRRKVEAKVVFFVYADQDSTRNDAQKNFFMVFS
ncbi:hypothetical protein EVAR_9052_1 [Eumeta japonica]|uniref:Uncharacterized protein n=1 Tax=Eumeta variegata TaxID=151549 RepID=A0A4C1TW31_EUMVA|nr:hypothetical protein EVAR_9052_1 [Eumeta japonica]